MIGRRPAADAGPEDDIRREEEHVAHNYHPLPVVVESGQGAWVTDVTGRRYLDCLAAYSAVNFGHGHPGLLAAARDQLDRITLTSRAFHNDRLGPFAEALAQLAGKDMVLPMNTGAEAVESAIKVARAWGYRVKGVPRDRARIIVMDGNFHGRTTTIVSFSTDEQARADFGPFTPGFDVVPYGDAAALDLAITEDTVAVLLEPIQGEGGIHVARAEYLQGLRRICDERGWLLMFDEIQCGLGRTGYWFASQHAGVKPDVMTLAKGLGSGVPIGACLAAGPAAGVFKPGNHGSTFGGNPLACTAALTTLAVIEEDGLLVRAATLGAKLRGAFAGALEGQAGVVDIRGDGLMIGIELDRPCGELVMRALERGLLINVTAEKVVRLLPALVFSDADAEELVSILSALIREFLA